MNVKRLIAMSTSIGVFIFMLAMPVFAQHGTGGGGHAGGATGVGHGEAGTHGESTTGGGKNSASPASIKGESVGTFLSEHKQLSSNLSKLLPTGTTLTSVEAMPFKNLGQLVATIHVYHNLGLAEKVPPVPFSEFASAVTGGSLGKAITKFDPSVNATAESKKGTKEANDDLKEASAQG